VSGGNVTPFYIGDRFNHRVLSSWGDCSWERLINGKVFEFRYVPVTASWPSMAWLYVLHDGELLHWFDVKRVEENE
jgi:hypothetical protein